MAGVMVWCQSCHKVVWAYDHMETIDLRGIMNLMKMPCPKCGAEGNFDGWCSNERTFDNYDEPDLWSVMKHIARDYHVDWEPSPDNRWFPNISVGGYHARAKSRTR